MNMLPPKRVERSRTQCVHTPCPEGYLQWHAWADAASKTHAQVKCPCCGRWSVWLPKAEARAVNSSDRKAANEMMAAMGLPKIPRDCW